MCGGESAVQYIYSFDVQLNWIIVFQTVIIVHRSTTERRWFAFDVLWSEWMTALCSLFGYMRGFWAYMHHQRAIWCRLIRFGLMYSLNHSFTKCALGRLKLLIRNGIITIPVNIEIRFDMLDWYTSLTYQYIHQIHQTK